MFKKIWKDPVWSKVIAGIILALGSLLFVWIKSLIEKVSIQIVLKEILEIKIRLVYAVAIIILYLIIRAIYRIYSLRGKQARFIKEVNRFENPDTGILIKWEAGFLNDTPMIIDLSLFCTRHENIPIRFVDYKCPMPDCVNSIQYRDKRLDINLIESILINSWERYLHPNMKRPEYKKEAPS
jgi:hypothetical protein